MKVLVTGSSGLIGAQRFDLIVHCAAQPSHDKARDIPLLDFEVNALGTVNLLEATRQHCREAVFVFLSTNKVYGEVPNEIPLKELETRYDYARAEDYAGVGESCRIRSNAAFALRGIESGGGSRCARVWTLLQYEGGNLSRWLPDGAVAFRRGV